MKNASLVMNAVLLVLVAILFYLHFSSTGSRGQVRTAAATQGPAGNNAFKIAYFELDSLENHFILFKDVKREIDQKNEANTREKMRLRQLYQDKVSSYQHRQLSQQESEAATREIQQMEENIRNQMDGLEQSLQDFSMRQTKDLKSKIEEYLKEYNKTKGYAFVFAYDPGLSFYKDTAYDITRELITGLNERYSPPKK